MTFDTEKFIQEIERRPAIWDMSLDKYTNSELKKKLWEELVNIFGSNLMKPEEKKEMCHNLQKKWKNIRDCYTRELRRAKSAKNGSSAKRKSQYIYFDNLQFLKTTANEAEETNMQENTETTTPTDLHSVDSMTGPPSSKKKKDEENSDKELIDILTKGIKKREENEHLQSDEDRLFLLSLLPDLKQVPEHLKLKTKIDMMIVLDKAKEGCSSFDYLEQKL